MTAPAPTGADGTAGRHPELAGRVAVVTGAGRGIGLGIVRRLAVEGMRVVLFDIDGPSLDVVSAGLDAERTLAVEGDIGVLADVDRLFSSTVERFGTVDLVVNNAADLGRREVIDEHQELLDLQLAVNVVGPYVCSQRAAAIMATNQDGVGGGVIVNLSSVGATRAHHDGVPYDVTKGAIDAMTRAMAVDLGRHGIRVNAVAPGVTITHRSTTLPDSPAGRTMIDGIPLRRFGSVGDIAATVAFLASDDASYITGQVLVVDGGITAQLSPGGPHAF